VGFIRRVRPAITTADDRERNLDRVVAAITGEGRGPGLTRVIYTESHDDVANDQVRVPEAISPGDADSWWAKKRASLGSALVLTSPGIPMLFQGQELLEDRWFDDTVALDWSKASTHEGILRLHRDLITLRRDGVGLSGGLRGTHVAIIRSDRDRRLLVMHRWADGGPGDDVVVAADGVSASTATAASTPPTSRGTRPSTRRPTASRPTASRRAPSSRWDRTAWSSSRRTRERGIATARVMAERAWLLP
jgi:1,4-alpha-glucan branching enzyme